MDSTEIVMLGDDSPTTEVDPNMDSTPPPIASPQFETWLKHSRDDFRAKLASMSKDDDWREGVLLHRKIAMDVGKKSSNLFRYSSDMG